MLDCQSSKFSLPPEVSYLNCAYMSPLLVEVALEGEYQIKRKSIPYTIHVADFYEPVEELKQTFAQLVNIPNPERVAVIPSASYGLASVARNLPAKDNFNIVMVEEQFPSNYYIWNESLRNKEEVSDWSNYLIQIKAGVRRGQRLSLRPLMNKQHCWL